MSELTPTEIFNRFKNKEIDKSTAVNYLKSFIENSNDEELRIESLNLLDLIGLKNNEIFGFLENLLISDSNGKIRGKSARILIQNYLDKTEKILKWVLDNEKSIKCLLEIYNSLSNIKNEVSSSLLKLMEISVGKEFVSKYNLVPYDAIILGLLRLSHNHITFFGNADGGGSGEFHLYFKSEQGCIKELYCHNFIPEFGLLKHVHHLKNLKINDHESRRINFRGLEGLISLEYLELDGIEIKSIESLRELKALINLRELHLINTTVPEIKYINSLTQLEKVVISAYDNPDWNGLIAEIIGLDTLKNLKFLDLSGNRIKEISGLNSLTNLKYLNLCDNRITEIKGLEKLKNLEVLDLSKNEITEIKGFESLLNLKILHLSYNQIKEIKNLNNLKNLTILGLNNNLFKIEEVYSQYRKQFFNDFIFKKYLMSIIASHGNKTDKKLKALEYLEALKPSEPYIWRYLVNLLGFHKHENTENINIKIIEILIQNYFNESIETIKNTIKYSKSQEFIERVYDFLKLAKNSEYELLIKYIDEYKRSS